MEVWYKLNEIVWLFYQFVFALDLLNHLLNALARSSYPSQTLTGHFLHRLQLLYRLRIISLRIFQYLQQILLRTVHVRQLLYPFLQLPKQPQQLPRASVNVLLLLLLVLQQSQLFVLFAALLVRVVFEAALGRGLVEDCVFCQVAYVDCGVLAELASSVVKSCSFFSRTVIVSSSVCRSTGILSISALIVLLILGMVMI
eukprot:TRINITY_DN1662_c0_g4_i2.p1 TRINITY_DN1662_c0_g4~~TRINITY_DN1662_c0_g4_i2.p1  ORF type:complete len:234 (+),score=28.80 TRINITY_DN1662_c0_g4_i2:106-702(+)